MTQFVTPVGRLLQGDPFKAQTTDAMGQPMVFKTGQNKGQPKVSYFVSVGIPKGSESHWNQTSWGQTIWAEGQMVCPKFFNQPNFAWKVIDGDSPLLDQKGNAINQKQGFPGHWVIRFNSGFAPKVVNKTGSEQIHDPEALKLGYYVQVLADVACEDRTVNPGVYLNFSAVSLQAYGEEIIVAASVDTTNVGFGSAALPVGASAAPMAGFTPVLPSVKSPALPVPTNPAILQVPVPTPAPAPVPVRQMSSNAQGATYEQMIQAGWTDELLTQHGMFA